ncbi:uncharacterized protein N7511_001133 [Penicillium nucicola]|uniref:uncharacterized protein n=1 Tax=Penicillium nucicola TaxID=1850975 RepID=UPI0025450666|nr:uncharacterized protein N7511_001133 [Penicillium nucicola]KAJ5776122.1 hypothetical protein N7511_001133 [Penicillium nucicola]
MSKVLPFIFKVWMLFIFEALAPLCDEALVAAAAAELAALLIGLDSEVRTSDWIIAGTEVASDGP